VNFLRSRRLLVGTTFVAVASLIVAGCSGPTIPAGVLAPYAAPSGQSGAPNLQPLLIPLAAVPYGWEKEPTPPSTLTRWKMKGCDARDTNFADVGAVPDVYELLIGCPTTSDINTIWSKLNWPVLTAAHWHKTASYPQYGAGSRSFTLNYTDQTNDFSCTAYGALFHEANVLGIVGYCDDEGPQGAIKLGSENWVAQAVARIKASVTKAFPTTTTRPHTTTTRPRTTTTRPRTTTTKPRSTSTTTKPRTTTTTTRPRPTTTTTTRPVTTTSHPTTTTTTPGVGGTLSFEDANGVPYTVSLQQVIDPAPGADQDNQPDPGDRFVAAEFVITDTSSSATTSDDANNDATVVGSDDQTYDADFDDVAGCTNFNDGLYQLSPGQSATGCVVFQLPTSVTVATVEWSASGVFGGTFGEWKVG
jgi:hypothetical protein